MAGRGYAEMLPGAALHAAIWIALGPAWALWRMARARRDQAAPLPSWTVVLLVLAAEFDEMTVGSFTVFERKARCGP